jgi:hypothetical protein
VFINDWYDGRIDRTYPVRCYREALRVAGVAISPSADAAQAFVGANLAEREGLAVEESPGS